jgi:hypothetical protein
MKAAPATDAAPRHARHAPVVVEHPLLRVIESEGPADPGAIADALELIVKWAVRAHTRCNPSMGEAAEIAPLASIGAGEQA